MSGNPPPPPCSVLWMIIIENCLAYLQSDAAKVQAKTDSYYRVVSEAVKDPEIVPIAAFEAQRVQLQKAQDHLKKAAKIIEDQTEAVIQYTRDKYPSSGGEY